MWWDMRYECDDLQCAAMGVSLFLSTIHTCSLSEYSYALSEYTCSLSESDYYSQSCLSEKSDDTHYSALQVVLESKIFEPQTHRFSSTSRIEKNQIFFANTIWDYWWKCEIYIYEYIYISHFHQYEYKCIYTLWNMLMYIYFTYVFHTSTTLPPYIFHICISHFHHTSTIYIYIYVHCEIC